MRNGPPEIHCLGESTWSLTAGSDGIRERVADLLARAERISAARLEHKLHLARPVTRHTRHGATSAVLSCGNRISEGTGPATAPGPPASPWGPQGRTESGVR